MAVNIITAGLKLHFFYLKSQQQLKFGLSYQIETEITFPIKCTSAVIILNLIALIRLGFDSSLQ